MHSDDDEEDRTVIRPPSARTQAPLPAVPRTHHATQHPEPTAIDPHATGHGASHDPVTTPPATTPPDGVGQTQADPAMQKTQVAPPPFSMPAAAPGSTPATQHALTLPAGTRLGEFEVTELIGEGGFGLVYLAWDHSLQRKVALKEYMPSSIASRVGESEIRPRSARHQETFEAGLKSFINEARLLAQFDHPSLLKVYRFWEANGTAYMVMPFLEGATLRDTVRNLPEPPDEAWILALLAPLFDALTMLHSAQIYHRDIAPDNVLLMADTGRPLLLDFGAARRVIGDMTQALTAILKPGYAPVEQYAEVPGMKQGPWTDVYALAAVVHWMILGKTPSPSVGRMFDDAQVSVADKAAGRYSAQFLGAIDRALAVLPDKRTQTIDDFRRDLTGDAGAAPLPSTAFALPPTIAFAGSAASQTTTGAAAGTGSADDRTLQPTVPPRTRAGPGPAAPVAPAGAPKSRSRIAIAVGSAVAIGVVAAAAVALWPRAADRVTTPSTAATATPPVASHDAAASGATTTATPGATVEPTTVTAVEPPASSAAVDAASAVAPTRLPPVAAELPTAPRDTPPVQPRPPRETRSTTTATRRPATRNDPPAEARPERRERATATTPEYARPAEPKPPSDSQAECGRLFQRLSLGEADQALMDRIRALRCR